MKTLSCFILFFVLLFPVITNGQAACESGISQETCSAMIPADAVVVQGKQTYSFVSLFCYWVCSGDTLILTDANDCSVYMEPLATLQLRGEDNYVWAKSESKVEILVNSFNTTLGILEDVVFIDDGTGTNETICNEINFNYFLAPDDGCDLTSVSSGLEPSSIQFYPNPVSGKASILFTTQESFYEEIYLSDSFGRLIKKWKTEGQQTISLALNGISPGVYLIHVPNTNLVKKIVVF